MLTFVVFSRYFQNSTQRLDEFVDTYKEDGLSELNSIAYAHVMTLDLDDQKRFSYSGVDIHEGQIRLLFSPDGLGSNISSCLSRDYLLKALNDAPAPEGASLSFAARTSIRQYYDPKIEEVREKAGELLSRPDIKFNPNFEDTFAKLLAESKVKKSQLTKEWEQNLGSWTKLYFSGFLSQLNWQKFEDDELLQEGFNEAVEKGEVTFRIVDKLTQGSYNECVIEDGVLYLQVRILWFLGGSALLLFSPLFFYLLFGHRASLTGYFCRPHRRHGDRMSMMLLPSSWTSCKRAVLGILRDCKRNRKRRASTWLT